MIRGLLFYIYIIIVNTLLMLATFWLVFIGRKACIFAIRMWTMNTYLAAKYIIGIDHKIVGEIPKHPVIIASKHQSAWETMFFPLIIPYPVFVLKKELKWFPWLAFYVDRAGYIPIDRKKGATELKKMAIKAREAIKEGSTVVIFPDGTRKAFGEAPKYKSGIAMLYASLPDVDVIPVSLNSGKFWPRNSIAKKPGTVTVTFHKPMPKGLSKKEFMKKLEEVIEGGIIS